MQMAALRVPLIVSKLAERTHVRRGEPPIRL